MAQQYAGLERSGLDLQRKQLAINQDMIDFNKKMLVTQTAIQGVRAGVDVFNAIDNYSKQKETKLRTERQAELQPILANGIQTGDIRVDYDENGKPVYSGLDDDTETGRAIQAWKAKYENRIEDEMGGMRWGNAGRARESLEQDILESYYGALNGAVQKRYNDTFNLFTSNYNDKIQEAVQSGDIDAVEFEKFMEESRGLMSPEIWEQKNTEGLESIRNGINYSRLENEICEIARTNGMGAVDSRLAEYRFPGKEGEEGRSLTAKEINDLNIIGQRARDQQMKPRQEALNGEWEKDLAEVDWFNYEQLNRAKAALREQRDDFTACDNERSYNNFMGRLYRREQELASRSGGSGSGNSTAKNNYMYDTFELWARGEITRDEMWDEFASIRNSLTASERTTYTKLIGRSLIADDGDTATQDAFIIFGEFADSVKMPEAIRTEFERSIFEMRANNCKPQEMVEAMQRMTNETIGKMIVKAAENPNASFSPAQWRELNAAAVRGELGYFDFPYAGENQQYGMREIPGTAALQKGLIGRNRTIVSNELAGTGWEMMDEGSIQKSGYSILNPDNPFESRDDHTGLPVYRVRNGDRTETVYVGEDGRLRKEDGSSFDGEMSAGRAEVVRQVQERISSEGMERIRDVQNRLRTIPGGRVPGTRSTSYTVGYLETVIKRELGIANRRPNAEEETFIEEMTAEFRRVNVGLGGR